MDFRQGFHEAYCGQQGIPFVNGCGVPHAQLRLLYEDERVWVVLNNGSLDQTGKWLNVVAKETDGGQRQRESVELW